MEPYYLNRFVRQFGFDQSIPANLSFAVPLRRQRNMMDLTRAVATLYNVIPELNFSFQMFILKDFAPRVIVIGGLDPARLI